MNEIMANPFNVTAKTIEDCKKQANERLRQIDEARKVIEIVTNIVRNYTGPKNAALCTKINKNADILELFPGWPKRFGVSFETMYKRGKDYSKLQFYSSNNFLNYNTFYLNGNYGGNFEIDSNKVENSYTNWMDNLNRGEGKARFLFGESCEELKNFREFFAKLESLKNEYKNVLEVFNIYKFPYFGKLSIY